MDIGLAGRTHNTPLEHIANAVEKVCAAPCEADGINFIPASIETSRIKEDAEYEAARVRLEETLARARIRMQIDVGFGDVTVPSPMKIDYPTMLQAQTDRRPPRKDAVLLRSATAWGPAAFRGGQWLGAVVR